MSFNKGFRRENIIDDLLDDNCTRKQVIDKRMKDSSDCGYTSQSTNERTSLIHLSDGSIGRKDNIKTGSSNLNTRTVKRTTNNITDYIEDLTIDNNTPGNSMDEKSTNITNYIEEFTINDNIPTRFIGEKSSFKPYEITGRSTSLKGISRSHQGSSNRPSDISVHDLLADSQSEIIRKKIEQLEDMKRQKQSKRLTDTWSQSLPRTADISSNWSERSSRNTGWSSGSFSGFTPMPQDLISDEEFLSDDRVKSVLMQDENDWHYNYDPLPNKSINEKFGQSQQNDADFSQNANPINNSNFSIGQFFGERNNDIQEIFVGSSPKKRGFQRPVVSIENDNNQTLDFSLNDKSGCPLTISAIAKELSSTKSSPLSLASKYCERSALDAKKAKSALVMPSNSPASKSLTRPLLSNSQGMAVQWLASLDSAECLYIDTKAKPRTDEMSSSLVPILANSKNKYTKTMQSFSKLNLSEKSPPPRFSENFEFDQLHTALPSNLKTSDNKENISRDTLSFTDSLLTPNEIECRTLHPTVAVQPSLPTSINHMKKNPLKDSRKRSRLSSTSRLSIANRTEDVVCDNVVMCPSTSEENIPSSRHEMWSDELITSSGYKNNVQYHHRSPSPSVSRQTQSLNIPLRSRSRSISPNMVAPIKSASSSTSDLTDFLLKSSKTQLSFPSTKLRKSEIRSFTLKNAGHRRTNFEMEIIGPGFQICGSDVSSIMTLQPHECRKFVVSFCPTTPGPAFGRICFSRARNIGNHAPSTIYLYGYGGHTKLQIQGTVKGLIGPTYLKMGNISELNQLYLERTFRIYNKGPLCGMASISLNLKDSNQQPASIHITPRKQVIYPNGYMHICVRYQQKWPEVKKMMKSSKEEFISIGTLSVIMGDEPSRQRITRLLRNVDKSFGYYRKIDSLLNDFPGEIPEKLKHFKENQDTIGDLYDNFVKEEIELTLHRDSLDDTIASNIEMFASEMEESMHFRTIIEDDLMNNSCASSVQMHYPPHELMKKQTFRPVQNDCLLVQPNHLNMNPLDSSRSQTLLIHNISSSVQRFEIDANFRHAIDCLPQSGAIPPNKNMEIDVKISKTALPSEVVYLTIYTANSKVDIPVNIDKSGYPKFLR